MSLSPFCAYFLGVSAAVLHHKRNIVLGKEIIVNFGYAYRNRACNKEQRKPDEHYAQNPVVRPAQRVVQHYYVHQAQHHGAGDRHSGYYALRNRVVRHYP